VTPPAAALTVGLRGQVVGLLGVRADFEVTAVDEASGTWSWTVRSGPVRLTLDHAVGDGWTTLTVSGPALAVVSYLPVARLALRRLVAV
jgi:predicted NUDIX family NTP pyrophosphohydrolase